MKKIVVLGPESTGKSFLAELLAKHFKGVYVPEYAREFLEKNNNKYSYEDIDLIAKGQLLNEDNAIKEYETSPAKGPIFLDTDMQVMMVWSEYVFNTCKSWILQEVASRKYDLFLLCSPDIPWIKDAMREYEDLATRETIFEQFHAVLQEQATPFIIIKGDYEARTALAIKAVEAILK